MLGLVKSARGLDGLQLREVPVPEPIAGEVVVRVHRAAVCATDVHIWHDAFTCAMPVVLGHEFAGAVEAVGHGVDGLAMGDLVVCENNPDACGKCPLCRSGYPNICTAKRAIGFKRDGCFAEYLRVPAAMLHRVPAGVPSRAATLSEPLAVAVHAVEDRCGVNPGDTIVVTGPGAIGLLAAQVARANGAAHVVVAGTNADAAQRLPLASELGFDTCNVQTDSLHEQVLELTGGHGADAIIEASGATPAILSAIDLVRRGGRIVGLGLTGGAEIKIPWDTLVAKAVSLLFAYSSRAPNWEQGLQYLAEGNVQTLPLITNCFAFADWRAAFELMERGGCIRSLLEMGSE
jgi:threonine dehydrogenase-like Zn-dependent dehydrogenase